MAGATKDVAVPLAAVVMVAPAENEDVEAGANQTLLAALEELTIVTVAPPWADSAEAKTVF